MPITKSGQMETNWLIDLKAFKAYTEVTGTDSVSGQTVTKQKTFRGILPSVGFGIKSNFVSDGSLQGFAEISGMPLGKYGKFYDAEAGIKYNVTKDITVNAGYRIINLDFDKSNPDEHGKLRLAGPFFGALLRF